MIDTEDLFKSIDTIVSARLENLPYDKTIQCVITNNVSADTGRYVVQYQGAHFSAYSDYYGYELGDAVYVQINRGNYSDNKIIIGKVPEDEEETTTSLQYSTYISTTENYYADTYQVEYSIPINGRSTTTIIGSQTIKFDEPIIGYTNMGVKANFLANLYTNDIQACTGNYGIKLVLYTVDQNSCQTNLSNNSLKRIAKKEELFLTTEDMICMSYYKTLGYCFQSKVFDITDKAIVEMTAYLYQDGNFLDQDGVEIPTTSEIEIYLKNLIIDFGYQTYELDSDGNQVFIYSTAGYNYVFGDIYTTMKWRLIKNYEDYTENSLDEKFVFTWKVYDAQAAISSGDISRFVDANVQDGKDSLGVRASLDSSKSIKTQKYKLIVQEYTARNSSLLAQKYTSEEITYTNSNYQLNSDAIDAITGLTISCSSDDYNGVYNIYKQDNTLLNSYEKNKTRYLLIEYTSSQIVSRKIEIGDIITIKVPISNTMISLEDIDSIFTGEIEEFNDELCIITHTITGKEDASIYSTTDKIFQFPYKIAEIYNPNYTDNTIRCEIEGATNGIDIVGTASKELKFGLCAIEDEAYNLNLKLSYWQGGVYKGDINSAIEFGDLTSKTFKVYFDLLDYNKINVDTDQSWKLNKNNSQEYITGITKITYSTTCSDGFYTIDKDTGLLTFLKTEESDFTTALDPGIIKVVVKYREVELTGYLPLAIKSNYGAHKYIAITGATTINYSASSGESVSYKGNYTIIGNDGNAYSSVYWTASPTTAGYPQLKSTDGVYSLYPASVYINNLSNFKLMCFDETYENRLCWIQPILIIANKTSSTTEISSDTDLTFEEENDIIYTVDKTLVGEMSYTNDKLSGVIIGNIKQSNEENSLLGIYSFYQNQKIFSVDESGYVYINGRDDSVVDIENSLISNCTLGGKISFASDLDMDAVPEAITAQTATSATTASNYSSSGTIASKIAELEDRIATLESKSSSGGGSRP